LIRNGADCGQETWIASGHLAKKLVVVRSCPVHRNAELLVANSTGWDMSEKGSGAGIVAGPHKRLDARIYLLAATVFATGTDASVVAGILPALAQDLNIGSGAAGQLLTAYMVAFAVGSPLFAALFGAWRRGRMILACLAIFALADGLCAIAPSYLVLMTARILAACCSATYTPAAFGLGAGLSPPLRRSAGLAIVTFGVLLAQLCGVPIGTWVAYHLGWRMTFVIDMGLVLLAAAAVWAARLPDLSTGPALTLGARLAPLASPKLILALLPSILWGAANNGLYLYTAYIFGPRFGLDSIPWLFAVSGLGGLVGSQLGGWLTDRYGPAKPIFACLLMSAIDLAVLNVVAASFVGTASAIFVLGCCAWALFPSQQSLLLALEPRHSAVVLSLNNSASYLGLAAGAVLGAIVLSQASTATVPYVASATMVAALTLWLVGRGTMGQTRRAVTSMD
jgi:MFS transporter, DHA1 family, inner membrane transport protein